MLLLAGPDPLPTQESCGSPLRELQGHIQGFGTNLAGRELREATCLSRAVLALPWPSFAAGILEAALGPAGLGWLSARAGGMSRAGLGISCAVVCGFGTLTSSLPALQLHFQELVIWEMVTCCSPVPAPLAKGRCCCRA